MPTQIIITDRVTAQNVVLEVVEVLSHDPDAICPPSLAALLAAEMDGRVWNFERGCFEGEES